MLEFSSDQSIVFQRLHFTIGWKMYAIKHREVPKIPSKALDSTCKISEEKWIENAVQELGLNCTFGILWVYLLWIVNAYAPDPTDGINNSFSLLSLHPLAFSS